MKLHFLLISLFSFTYAYSQHEYRPGYIVKLDGKTEQGLINFMGSEFNAKKCEFKISVNSDPVTYLPNQITAYRLNDSKYFLSKNVLINNIETNLFLECLISGKSTIYYTKWNSLDHYYIEIDGKFVELENNEIVTIGYGQPDRIGHSNQYRRILNYCFKDCPPVLQKLENADFSKKSLINLSKEYHEYVCKDQQCIIYEKKIPKKRIGLGIDFSYGIGKLEFNQSTLFFSLKSINQYQFNINSQIKLDEAGAYNLKVSLGYYSYKNELLDNTKALNLVSSPNDIYYKYSILKPSVQLKYKLKNNKIIPFASAGLFSAIFLTDKGELYSHNFKITVPFTSDGIDRVHGSMSGMLGGIFDIGFETALKPGYISFSLFYERFLTTPFISSYNLGLKCGYYFYF